MGKAGMHSAWKEAAGRTGTEAPGTSGKQPRGGLPTRVLRSVRRGGQGWSQHVPRHPLTARCLLPRPWGREDPSRVASDGERPASRGGHPISTGVLGHTVRFRDHGNNMVAPCLPLCQAPGGQSTLRRVETEAVLMVSLLYWTAFLGPDWLTGRSMGSLWPFRSGGRG